MFIIEQRGIRLSKRFYVFMCIAMLVVGLGPFLTMHIHYDPGPKSPAKV